jgi:prepilin-type N-terminal cleavage/methylation domain-containing protein
VTRLRRALDPRFRAAGLDAGFTLVETVIALMIISVGMLGLMGAQLRSIGLVGLANQRQSASALVNRAMEQMRALPYGTVTGGMVCADLASDANVTGGTGTCPSARLKLSGIDEAIVVSTGTQIAPLNPHIQPLSGTKIGKVQYTVKAYVTRVVDTDLVGASGYWLTVVGSWSSNLTSGLTKVVSVRSQLYSPPGCLSNVTHPFSGPCQAFLYTDAGSHGGTLSVQSNRAGLGLIDGLDAFVGSVALPGLSTRLQSEQTVSAQSDVATSGGKITGSVTNLSSGGITGTSSADTDPSTGATRSPPAATTATQSAAALTANSAGSALTVTPASADAGSTFSTMTAQAAPACADTVGTTLLTAQACSSSTLTPSGTSSIVMSGLPLLGARTVRIGDAAAGASASRAYGARFLTGLSLHCTATSGAGCVAAGAARVLGAAHAGGLASQNAGDKVFDTRAGSVDVTAAFAANPSLVSLTGYSDTVAAESGVSPAATSYTRAGSLVYWSGAGFTTVPLGFATNAVYTVGRVTAVYGTLSIVVSGNVTVTPASAVTGGSAPCTAAACTVDASAGGVVAQLTYSVLVSGTEVGNFTATLDVGNALAQTTYLAAPLA